MFDLVHQMRVADHHLARASTATRCSARSCSKGRWTARPTASRCPRRCGRRGVVPFLKVDKGLEDEADGVQLMKPNPGLDALARPRRGARAFSGPRCARSSTAPARAGSRRWSAQQFEVAKQILGQGLMPIIEPEVSIKSADRAESDDILLGELLKALDALPDGRQVMLKLSLPVEAGLFEPLVDHPRVLKVVALSGGFSRDEACRELAQEPGRDRQLQPRAARRPSPRHERRRIQRARSATAIDEIYDASIGQEYRLNGRRSPRSRAVPAAPGGALRTLPDQPAGRRRRVSRPAQGGARAGHRRPPSSCA